MFSTWYDLWRFYRFNRRTFADKVLHYKAFDIAKDSKYDGYQCEIALMAYTFFDKKLLVKVLKMKVFLRKNYQKNYINQLLENLIKEKYTHLLKTIFGGGGGSSRYAVDN